MAVSPCDWPIDYMSCGVDDGVPPVIAGLTPTQRTTVEEMAVDYLWHWTGRSFGLCPVTVRPCRQDCTVGMSTFTGFGQSDRYLPHLGGSGAPWTPALVGGRWLNISCGSCGDLCSCSSVSSLALPGPVDSVTSVVIDGAALPTDAYRVDNRRYLLRLDGGSWPTCQDMSAPSEPGSTATGTWQVSYVYGTPVPSGGQLAAGLLASEFAKALCRDASCQLPKRVQSITRQGVTVAVLDAFDDIDTGHTGIWMIDAWIASVTKPPRPSRVFSPDLPRSRFRSTTWAQS